VQELPESLGSLN